MFKNICCAILLLVYSKCPFAQVSGPLAGINNLGNYNPLPALPSLTAAALPVLNIPLLSPVGGCPCTYGCYVLPVTLLSFDASRKDINHVLLNWKTTNEYNNHGFDVQRSLGNTSRFETVAFVPSKANNAGVKKYELTDNNNYEGISYYRLKQTDLDGKFSFSETVAVKGYTGQSTLALYPNPVKENLTADIYAAKNGRAVLVVLDATQKQLYTQNIFINKGINLINIAAAHLAGGIYFVKIIYADGDVVTGKFIKK